MTDDTAMTTRTLRTGLFFGIALGVLTIMAAPVPGVAQDFAPAMVVNDEIITGYDIEQRQRLLSAASGGKAVGRQAAVDALVDDILRLQAARRAGINPSQEDINAGFADLARGQGRDPQTMRRYFRSKGVSDRHLDNQIKAEVAWRELIPQTYMPRVRVSDAEVAEAQGTGGAAPTEPEFLLSEIRLPIGAAGQNAAMAQARTIVQQLQGGQMTFGDLARQFSRGPSAASGGDLGWVGLSRMSPDMQRVIGPMSKDRVSNPFIDGTDVTIIGVRNTRAPSGQAATRYQISQLVVGVAPDAAPSIASLAQQQALAARANVTDCASIEGLKANYLPISGEVGTLTPAEMPAAVRNAVLALPVGGISQPIRSNDGFHIIVLCDKISGAATAGPADQQVRRQLVASKLGRHSASLLRKLRREAVIERR